MFGMFGRFLDGWFFCLLDGLFFVRWLVCEMFVLFIR